MINTTHIKITTSQSNRQTDPHKSRKSSLGHLDFGANINKALKKNPQKSLSQSDGLSRTNPSFKKKGHPFYLGSAPKGPFAPEKALNPVSINRRDLALLKKILLHSGLSRKQVKGFLKGLAQGRRSGLSKGVPTPNHERDNRRSHSTPRCRYPCH